MLLLCAKPRSKDWMNVFQRLLSGQKDVVTQRWFIKRGHVVTFVNTSFVRLKYPQIRNQLDVLNKRNHALFIRSMFRMVIQFNQCMKKQLKLVSKCLAEVLPLSGAGGRWVLLVSGSLWGSREASHVQSTYWQDECCLFVLIYKHINLTLLLHVSLEGVWGTSAILSMCMLVCVCV